MAKRSLCSIMAFTNIVDGRIFLVYNTISFFIAVMETASLTTIWARKHIITNAASPNAPPFISAIFLAAFFSVLSQNLFAVWTYEASITSASVYYILTSILMNAPASIYMIIAIIGTRALEVRRSNFAEFSREAWVAKAWLN